MTEKIGKISDSLPVSSQQTGVGGEQKHWENILAKDKLHQEMFRFRKELGLSKVEFDRQTERAKEVVKKMGFSALIAEAETKGAEE